MKNIPLFCLTLCIILSLYLSNGYAQDYTEWGLPEGAKMRLGKGEINDIKFSPDGKRLAVGTSIGIWIYDVHSRKEVTFMKSDKYQIDVLMFIENGMKIVSVGIDGPIGRIITWEVETETTPEKPNIPEIGDQLSGTGYFWASALSHDGNLLAIGNGSGSVNLWDLRTRNKISSFKAHSDPISGLTFSPDGSTLVSGSDDSKIHLWNVATQKRQETLTRSFGAHALAISPDGKRVASGSFGGSVQSWDLETKQKLVSFEGHTDAIRALTFSPDGKMLASGGWDATIRLWDTDTGNQIAIITGHPSFVEQMAFAPNGNFVAGSGRGVIRLWDTNTRRERPSQVARSYGLIKRLNFTKDSMQLKSADVEFALKVMDVATNRELFTQTFKKHKGGYWGIAFSNDRTMVANANRDKKIRIWNIATGDQMLSIRSKFKKPIIDLAFSVDGKMLAAAGEDESIRIWDTTTSAQLCILNGHTGRIESLAFSPDGKMLASGSWDGTMRLWDIETKTQISQRGDGFMGGIIEVQFSLDGKTVVSSSQSNRIQLWQVENKRQTPTVMLTGHNGWIRNIEFSADGKIFASGSDDGTILLWDWEKCSKLKGHNRY